MLFSYYRRPLFLLLLAYAGGILLFRQVLLKTEPLPFDLPRACAVVKGRVTEYPSATAGGPRFSLETETVYGRPLKAGLMVYAPHGTKASYGDTVEMLADLRAPRGAYVPGGLDWAGYLARRGITAQAHALELKVVKPAGPLLLLARKFRNSALDSFRRGLGGEAAAVFGGVVLGEKKSVPPDLKTAFQDSGAMHLLVASGSNVGFIVAIIYFLASRAGLRRRPAGVAAMAVSGFYVLAAGLDAPLVRAYLMFGAGLAAWLFRRESGAFHALTVAALLILIAWPRYLFNAGFQMSFLAAYGLTVGLALWGRGLKGIRGKALGLLLVSFFAQLCLYPLLAIYFHRVSLVSLISNMVLVPASGAAMALGFLLALSGGWLFAALANISALFMGFFIGAVRFFAALPFAALSVPAPSPLVVAGFFVLALALLHAPLCRGLRGLLLTASAGVLIAGFGLLQGMAAGAAARKAWLFGGGGVHSVLTKVPSGLYLVNPGLEGKKLAGAVLAAGRRSVDGVVLTSLEERNFGGLAELSARVKVREIFLPPGPVPGDLAEGSAARGIPVRTLWPGQGISSPAVLWGDKPGYSGRGDVFDWEIDGLRIRKGGLLVEGPCGSAPAESGKVVVTGISAGCGG